MLVRKPSQGETIAWTCFRLKRSVYRRCTAPVSSCSRLACRHGSCWMMEISQASGRSGNSCVAPRNHSTITAAPVIPVRCAATALPRVVAPFRAGQPEQADVLFRPRSRRLCATRYSIARFRRWAERESLDLDCLRVAQTRIQRDFRVAALGRRRETYRDLAICVPPAGRRAAARRGSCAQYGISVAASSNFLAGTTKVHTCSEYLGHE